MFRYKKVSNYLLVLTPASDAGAQLKVLFLSCYTFKVIAVLIFVPAMMSAITNLQNLKNIAGATTKLRDICSGLLFSGTPGTYLRQLIAAPR